MNVALHDNNGKNALYYAKKMYRNAGGVAYSEHGYRLIKMLKKPKLD